MRFLLIFLFSCFTISCASQVPATNNHNDEGEIIELQSPGGTLKAVISYGADVRWAIYHGEDTILDESPMALHLSDGEILGESPVLVDSKQRTVQGTHSTRLYKKKEVEDHYNELRLFFEGDYGLIIRAYDDGAAYRFFTSRDEELTVLNEDVNFNFTNNFTGFIPYLESREEDRYASSFESFYKPLPLSDFDPQELSYLPIVMETESNKRAALLEADVEDYPGMFIQPNQETDYGLTGYFARYPTDQQQGGHNDLQLFATERADYIARTEGNRKFPWRAVAVVENDLELLDNDMMYKLSSSSRIEDDSWIKPGKLAWDWWNNWNISGVDFQSGINTETYKYYIDFAAENNLEYILLDEGWSVQSNDLTETISDIDLEELVTYGQEKEVDILLWAGWLPIHRDMEEIFAQYADMGIKGFKIDFMDRNDQFMVNFHYRAARTAAEHELLVNFHGTYPPTGLQHTWPNVITFEAVRGLEYHKWSEDDFHLTNNVILPFTRMLAGPMDYTPGGMRNATSGNFRAINSMPMTQGTRSHQLAMYLVYDSPLHMLADNPTAYKEEQKSMDFIAQIPTTFDETIPLKGKIGEYIAVARKKGDTWYIGAMSNWDGQSLTLDASFLPEGSFEAVVFKDGINAHRNAEDYVRKVETIQHTDTIEISMAPGGGWAAILKPAK